MTADDDDVLVAAEQAPPQSDDILAFARTQTVTGRTHRQPPILDVLGAAAAHLRDIERQLRLGEGAVHDQTAAERYLDNHHLLQRAVRTVRIDMPAGFYRDLPGLKNDQRNGFARVYLLARFLNRSARGPLDLESLVDRVGAYQTVTELTTGELWALPAMLRVCCLQDVLASSASLASVDPLVWDPEHAADEARGVPTECLVRAIQNLHAIDDIKWKEFFRRTSAVERILADDPAQVYGRMDFETCDLYRTVIEDIARRTGRSEGEVARAAVDLAAATVADGNGTAQGHHVGFHLIGAGGRDFERQMGYRPRFSRRWRRSLMDHAPLAYLGGIVTGTLLFLVPPALYLVANGAVGWILVAALVMVLIPASALGVIAIQWLLTLALKPRTLPKMNNGDGIPETCRTLVVIPTLLTNQEDISDLLRRIEIHHLSNPDPMLGFALLTDFVDAPAAHMAEDDELVTAARRGIEALNARHGDGERGPFHLLHRERRFNTWESCWMGWERKRGKLDELNRILLGATDTWYVLHVGDPAGLRGIRFVITLDSDTLLPRDTAARLIGILDHPQNAPVVDPATGELLNGYTIVQPRIEIAPEVGRVTRFSRIYSGDRGIDIYSRAVSSVYQDLFRSGIFVGKGIYDVAAFQATLAGRVPDNAIASHDLFEGIHGRVALATDIVLFEDYPPHYLAYAKRLHRWLRGDWQLLPWLLPRVPAENSARVANRFSAIDRWKIIDNLRRSLLTPALLLFFLSGWTWLPGHPAAWTLLGLLAPAGHLLTGILTGLGHGRRTAGGRWRLAGMPDRVGEQTKRWLLSLVFLAYEAYVAADSIVRTLVRLYVTRRYLLQWRTAALTSRLLAGSRGVDTWAEMAAAPLIGGSIGALVALAQPGSLPWAAPLLLMWIASPEIARRLSEVTRDERRPEDPRDLETLRALARRTWLFFEMFVGPGSHWLPPDNHQESPGGETANRTSPTNIGIYLTSALAAWDLGYVTTTDLTLRLRRTMEAMARLERYRGHLLNWYDTRDLSPLLPRYVSTVDSGNLAGCLLALGAGCDEILRGPIAPPQQGAGLIDSLGLLETAVSATCGGTSAFPGIQASLSLVRTLCESMRDGRDDRWAVLQEFDRSVFPHLASQLKSALREAGSADPGDLHEMRTWLERLRKQARAMRRELGRTMPWLEFRDSPPAHVRDTMQRAAAATDWFGALPLPDEATAVADLAGACTAALAGIRDLRGPLIDATAAAGVDEVGAWLDNLEGSLQAGRRQAEALVAELAGLTERATREFEGMDFAPLYDREDHLFHIGFNVTANKLDANHYDLLASEARLASYIAIARGDVPQKHWSFLGRPFAAINGSATLLSWGGTMFEYLMPWLLMSSGRNTLLTRSSRNAIERQIAYGQSHGVPWGNSESGHSNLNPAGSYDYKSFGTPGLGLKRDLGAEIVVAPYASVLALPFCPRAVLDNLERMTRLHAMGPFGFYEALDFTPSRRFTRRPTIVASYMAHHQGMILTAIDNHVNSGAMQRRFRANPIVQTALLLLEEEVPVRPDVDPYPREDPGVTREPAAPRAILASWTPMLESEVPQLHVLSNGTLNSLSTAAGAGHLRWNGLMLTRWRADPTLQADGMWIYLRDEDTRETWTITRGPAGAQADRHEVLFHAHMVEYQVRANGIFARMEIVVCPTADVEVRLITLTNESSRPRNISVTSFAEVVLAPQQEHERHPAFSRMFVDCEAHTNPSALSFERRTRSAAEAAVVLRHQLVPMTGNVHPAGFATDRQAFIGRLRTSRRPRALFDRHLDPGQPATGDVATGDVATAPDAAAPSLDPILSLAAAVTLGPHETADLAFVTLAAGSKARAAALGEAHSSSSGLGWVTREAYLDTARRLHRADLDPAALPEAQRLLALLTFPLRRAGGQSGSDMPETRSRLWGLGISGDLPILLVRIHEPTDPALAEAVLRAYHYWRSCGIGVDVILLNERASSYDDRSLARLQEQVAKLRSDGGNRFGIRTNVMLLQSDQLQPAERRALEFGARVVLEVHSDGDRLEEQIQAAFASRAPLPGFQPGPSPAIEPEPGCDQERAPDLVFDNGLGGFSEDGSRYIIHLEPGSTTPAPWTNVLANQEFGCLVTESALGCTWAANSGENRLTPWHNDAVEDRPSEVLYLRDEETAESWSTTPAPRPAASAYQIQHGIGFTDYLHGSHGLRQRTRVFVAAADPVKLVRLRIENTWSRTRRLTATYYVDWVLGTTRQETASTIATEYEDGSAALLAHNPWNPDFPEAVAFLAASEPTHGVTTDRLEFLGRDGDYRDPAALGRWGLSGEIADSRDPCGVVQVHLELMPGQVKEIHFVLGQSSSRTAAVELAREYRDAPRADREWDAVAAKWKRLLGAIQVTTPEPAVDFMLNSWLPYQALSCRIHGRTAFYQSSGAFGFRDQLQDSLAFMQTWPDLAREHILLAASRQFEEGDVLHWWHPPSSRGVRTRCSDDMLWLNYAVSEYVRTTGDRSLLRVEVPFLTAPPLREDEKDRYGTFTATADEWTLLEHCRRAVAAADTRGPHELPLMKDGDWNDGMNRVGDGMRGESVWLGWFLLENLNRLAELVSPEEDRDAAARLTGRATALARALASAAWDGAWFRRAFRDDGTALGSTASTSCKIDSIAQSWAVLSGGADAERARTAVRSACEHLVVPGRLARLLWPPFRYGESDPGYIAAYPPGVRENGGQYSHAAAWLGCALAEIGDADGAMDIFRILDPILHTANAEDRDRYAVEPYAIAADIYSVAPHVGRGGWTWYTGAAAWTWRLGIEWILGLRTVNGRLTLDPCIPAAWPGFRATIERGSAVFAVHIDNPDGVSSGVTAMTVDGETIEGNAVPEVAGRGRREIVIRLGLTEREATRSVPAEDASG